MRFSNCCGNQWDGRDSGGTGLGLRQPKAGSKLVQHSGDELKLVYPQAGAEPGEFETLAFRHFFLQPMDGPSRTINTELALKYCLNHPQWRLSLQTHKFLGIP